MEVDAEIETLLSKRFEIKFWDKSNKVDQGYLNFSYYEIIIQSKAQDGKIKTNKSIAYAEISTIFIKDKENVMLDLIEKNNSINIQIENPLYLVKCVFVAFKIFFPCDDIFGFVNIKTCASISTENMIEEVKKMKTSPQSPCNNFTYGIKFYAKYSYLTENEEIIWDIDTVYANKDTRQFFLKDFDHLKQKYLFPVIGAMCYNTYFNELVLSHVDLTAYEKLLERVFKYNKKFRKLYFVNCNLKLALCASIANGLENQKSLVCLDLSCNEAIGEKGLDHFVPFLKKCSQYLEVFKMSKCNLNTVSICKIADAFTYNIRGNDSTIQLRVLDLSQNLLKEGFKEIFHEFLSKCNHLEDLNLANMNSSIEQMPNCLLNGPYKALKYLNLSENISPASSQSCTQWSLLFKKLVSLTEVNFSNFKSLHCSVTDGLLLGLQENDSLTMAGLDIKLSNCSFNGDNFNRFFNFIHKANCVTHLDISNNGIDMEYSFLITNLKDFPSLKSINMSNNFNNMKAKDINSMMMSLTLTLQSENVNLQELYMSNCNLGSNLSTFISELDCMFSLQILDISGNNIGNIVARTLGRMLTIDKHLKEIIMDNNNITKEIYEEILDGLEQNFTLSTFHVPFVDLVKYPSKLVVPIIDKINRHHVKVNKVFQGISFEDIKALAFSCIMNQTSENIEKSRSILQESCNRLKSLNAHDAQLKDRIKTTLEKSFDILKTVEKSRDLLSKLNGIYKNNTVNSSLSTDIRVKKVMETVCKTVSELINDYMHEVVDEMMNEIEKTVPMLFSHNIVNLRLELLDICKKAMVVSDEYIKKLFERFIEHNLKKKIYETQLNTTNLLCDRVTDEIISGLNICDMNTNKLLQTSAETNESLKPYGPVVPELILRESKRVPKSRTESVRNSRMSAMAAVKSRPISKAIKQAFKELQISEEAEKHEAPVVPARTKRLNITQCSEESEKEASPISPRNETHISSAIKNRPKPVKNIKPKLVTPTNISVEHSISISEEHWSNFHCPETNVIEKITEKSSKKKTAFFGLSKYMSVFDDKSEIGDLQNKKPKPNNIDFNDLGKEVLGDSDIDDNGSKNGSSEKPKLEICVNLPKKGVKN